MKARNFKRKKISLSPSLAEIAKAIRQMSNGKAPGAEGIPLEVFKKWRSNLVRRLVTFQNQMGDGISVARFQGC